MLGSLMRPSHLTSRRGFTLVEALVTLAILAILAALALPSMQDLIARKRLEGAAHDLASDLRLMRSMRLQNPRDVVIGFAETSLHTCYAVYHPGFGNVRHCNCGLSEELMCGASQFTERPELIKLVKLPKSEGLTIRSNVSRLFLLGNNALPGGDQLLDISLENADVGVLKVKTNIVFSAIKCVGSGNFSGFPACGPSGSWP